MYAINKVTYFGNIAIEIISFSDIHEPTGQVDVELCVDDVWGVMRLVHVDGVTWTRGSELRDWCDYDLAQLPSETRDASLSAAVSELEDCIDDLPRCQRL